MIPLRHTNRYPYGTGHPVTTATLDALSVLGDDADVRVFRTGCSTQEGLRSPRRAVNDVVTS